VTGPGDPGDPATDVHAGIVGGTSLAGNVRTLLSGVRDLLVERPTEFAFDLVVDASVDPPAGFRPIDPGFGGAATARGELVELTRGLRRYVREHRPDVLVQVTRFPTHGTAAAVAGLVTDTPTVTRLAGDNFREHRFAADLGERARTFALKNGIALAAVHLPEAVVVLGPTGRGDLARRFRRGGVHEVPQPVDTDEFHPVGESERTRLRDAIDAPPPDAGRMLLTVGRVSRRKGIPTLRRAARRLADDHGTDGEVVWYVVGDGPLRASLADVPGVRAVGRVPHERVVDYYRAADLYVHPSLHEGLPNVLLEATACGTPSVARDVGECATVATETFVDEDRLPALLRRSYDRVTLDDRFDDDRLARDYETVLTGVVE
jgi:glycosyltransferase involved in cell wall biosynthesis